MKKTVELSSKRKVDIKDMDIDDIDFCQDVAIMKYNGNEMSHIENLSKSRTAWLRRGIVGGDFKNFSTNEDGYISDKVIKQLNETEKNELVKLIQEYQSLGE